MRYTTHQGKHSQPVGVIRTIVTETDALAGRDFRSVTAVVRIPSGQNSVSARIESSGGSGRRGSRTLEFGGGSGGDHGSTSQPPRSHIHSYAHRSTSGVWYQNRTSRGIRSCLGTAPPGGVQFHAARTPGGHAQPPGDGTRSALGSANRCLSIPMSVAQSAGFVRTWVLPFMRALLGSVST